METAPVIVPDEDNYPEAYKAWYHIALLGFGQEGISAMYGGGVILSYDLVTDLDDDEFFDLMDYAVEIINNLWQHRAMKIFNEEVDFSGLEQCLGHTIGMSK